MIVALIFNEPINSICALSYCTNLATLKTNLVTNSGKDPVEILVVIGANR